MIPQRVAKLLKVVRHCFDVSERTVLFEFESPIEHGAYSRSEPFQGRPEVRGYVDVGVLKRTLHHRFDIPNARNESAAFLPVRLDSLKREQVRCVPRCQPGVLLTSRTAMIWSKPSAKAEPPGIDADPVTALKALRPIFVASNASVPNPPCPEGVELVEADMSRC